MENSTPAVDTSVDTSSKKLCNFVAAVLRVYYTNVDEQKKKKNMCEKH
jgi:hypothetical protein